MEDALFDFRRELHQFPELSGMEVQTARRIINYLKPCAPDLLIEEVGGHGVMAVFDSGRKGPEVLFRADMDSLPIHESGLMRHSSKNDGVSHKCGHDGHTAILAGLAHFISEHRPVKGKVLLLFQPAEETGMGARAVLNDMKFAPFSPDYSFALHNLPGYPENAVIIRTGTFAAASRGLIIKLKGRTSHACEPEKGRSPAAVMAHLMSALPRLAGDGASRDYQDFILLTLIYASLGTPAFGTTPGEATLMATLRAYLDSDMESLTAEAVALVKRLAKESQLDSEISFTEEFPATMNHQDAVDYVLHAAADLNLEIIEAGLPFRWSEDFAHFAGKSKAALFGIGAGVEHPSLHHPDYDFPDNILKTGVNLWKSVYQKLNL
ncbi:MAG: amidohydrolase [Lentimicrobiaceae bacterium]|nr:amidohydrolase [Lentimicrobiaceae bacterium]